MTFLHSALVLISIEISIFNMKISAEIMPENNEIMSNEAPARVPIFRGPDG